MLEGLIQIKNTFNLVKWSEDNALQIKCLQQVFQLKAYLSSPDLDCLCTVRRLADTYKHRKHFRLKKELKQISGSADMQFLVQKQYIYVMRKYECLWL